jgi:acyl carrier protein
VVVVVLQLAIQTSPYTQGDDMHSEEIRAIVAAHGRLLVDVATLTDESDLYEAGLTSLSTVNLMLALEEHFEVEFLDRMLKRKTFQSIQSLSDAVAELRGTAPTATAGAAEAAARGTE